MGSINLHKKVRRVKDKRWKIYEMERHFYLLIENDLYFDAKNSAMTYNNFTRNIGKKIIFCTPKKT